MVIINGINYPESMIVLDIRLDNFFLWYGYRKDKLNQDVFLFCPAEIVNQMAKTISEKIGVRDEKLMKN